MHRKEMYRISKIKKGKSKEELYYVLVVYRDDGGLLNVLVPEINKLGKIRNWQPKMKLMNL